MPGQFEWQALWHICMWWVRGLFCCCFVLPELKFDSFGVADVRASLSDRSDAIGNMCAKIVAKAVAKSTRSIGISVDRVDWKSASRPEWIEMVSRHCCRCYSWSQLCKWTLESIKSSQHTWAEIIIIISELKTTSISNLLISCV